MCFSEFFFLIRSSDRSARMSCFSVSTAFPCPTSFFPTESISEKGWGKVPQIVSFIPTVCAFEPECSIDGSYYRNANQVH